MSLKSACLFSVLLVAGTGQVFADDCESTAAPRPTTEADVFFSDLMRVSASEIFRGVPRYSPFGIGLFRAKTPEHRELKELFLKVAEIQASQIHWAAVKTYEDLVPLRETLINEMNARADQHNSNRAYYQDNFALAISHRHYLRARAEVDAFEQTMRAAPNVLRKATKITELAVELIQTKAQIARVRGDILRASSLGKSIETINVGEDQGARFVYIKDKWGREYTWSAEWPNPAQLSRKRPPSDEQTRP